MSKEHKIIVIPGLGDRTKPLELAANHWRKHGLEPIMHPVGWHDGEISFRPKLERLVEMIDSLTHEGDRVSLVGTSAGGSAALNAFIERSDQVHRIVNVCGRLRKGPLKGFRSFGAKTASSPAFANSVELCESREEELTSTDRKKIMTVRAMFGDELVPADTTVMLGGYNTLVPTPEHMLSIISSLTIFSKPLIVFLKQDLQ